MMNFFIRYKLQFIRATVVIFILGTFAGFGAYFFAPGGPTDTLIKVDRVKIPIHRYQDYLNRSLAQVQPGTVLTDQARQQRRDEVIRDLVTMVAYQKEADRYGVSVPDAQVQNSLAQVPAFQQNGQFSLEAYARALQYSLKVTPDEFEREQRTSIAFQKLRWLIVSCLHVTDDEVAMFWAAQGAEFAKAHATETLQGGKKTRRRTEAEVRDLFRQRVLEQKAMWVLNQWLTQVGSQLRVKTYLNRLERAGL